MNFDGGLYLAGKNHWALVLDVEAIRAVSRAVDSLLRP